MTDFLLRISAPLMLAGLVAWAAYGSVTPVVAQARSAIDERMVVIDSE